MSLANPWALVLAAAAAAAVVVLHLLARRQREVALPTARFVPDTPASATARAVRPSDPLLLALRVLALLLIGLAMAGPAWQPERQPHARVVLLDVSRAVADPGAARETAAEWLRPGDTLVVWDSAAATPGDLVDAPTDATSAPGSLGAALLAGYRAAAVLAERADSVELVIVGALVREQWDTATAPIRELWPGPIRLVRVDAASWEAPAGRVELDGDADDPLGAALALLHFEPTAEVRIVRGGAGGAELDWAGAAGRVLVDWPAAGEAGGAPGEPDAAGTAGAAGGAGEPVAAGVARVGGVAAGDAVVVAPFERIEPPPPGMVVARWIDGAPAATERTHGEGCVRSVRIQLPRAGDLVLRESTRRLVRTLLGPCGGEPALEPLDGERLRLIEGEGAAAVARPRPAHAALAPGPLGGWLMAAALGLLLVELVLRRRRPGGVE